MKVIDIATLAQQSGVPASTLRYYEQKGLIRSIGRHGLRRLFDTAVLDRLALIALGRSAGFSLKQIAPMFAPDGRVRVDRAKLTERADELDTTIRRLAAVRDSLRHAAVCPAPSHLECPTFQRLLRAASAAVRQPPHVIRSTKSPRKPSRQQLGTTMPREEKGA